MSARNDYIFALGVALGKKSTTPWDALRVVEIACALPESVFPKPTADDVFKFIQHGLGDGEAPQWLQEVRENEESAKKALLIRITHEGASWTWWKNARMLATAATQPKMAELLLQSLPGALYRVSPEQLEELRIWVADVPGESDEEQPFEVVDEEEESREE